ncbi:hypothetical protein BC940DRAFT_302644 [Gongronella butleri]|nr:hypothetical protein BC940DRAFT_302644 [Gongronella butleri]
MLEFVRVRVIRFSLATMGWIGLFLVNSGWLSWSKSCKDAILTAPRYARPPISFRSTVFYMRKLGHKGLQVANLEKKHVFVKYTRARPPQKS